MSGVERSSRQLSKCRGVPEMGKRGRPTLCKGQAGALSITVALNLDSAKFKYELPCIFYEHTGQTT